MRNFRLDPVWAKVVQRMRLTGAGVPRGNQRRLAVIRLGHDIKGVTICTLASKSRIYPAHRPPAPV